MVDRKKVIKGLECCLKESDHLYSNPCNGCPYEGQECIDRMKADALALLKEQDKEIKALRLLVEWAEECGFGFDQFHDEYERYKDEIKDMKYIDGMIHVAKRTLEDHGALAEGR